MMNGVHYDVNFEINFYLALKIHALLRILSIRMRILPSTLMAQLMNFWAQAHFLVKTK